MKRILTFDDRFPMSVSTDMLMAFRYAKVISIGDQHYDPETDTPNEGGYPYYFVQVAFWDTTESKDKIHTSYRMESRKEAEELKQVICEQIEETMDEMEKTNNVYAMCV